MAADNAMQPTGVRDDEDARHLGQTMSEIGLSEEQVGWPSLQQNSQNELPATATET